jgi:cytochrome P450
MQVMEPRPTAPKAHLIAGHLPEFRGDTLGFLTHCAREYGDLVPLRLGPRRAVLLNRPEYIEYVLVTNHRSFVKSVAYRVLRRALGEGLFTSDGELWKRQRQLAQPAFHRERIAAYAAVMADSTARMIDQWRDGEARDVDRDMMQLTLEIVTKALFGTDLSADPAEVGRAVTDSREQLMYVLSTLEFLLPPAVPTPANLRLRRAVRRLDDIVYRIIRDHRRRGEDTGDLLSMLLRAADESGRGMTDKQLRDEVMTVFVAGHETTAATLSWTWYLLSAHPQVDSALGAELRTVVGGRAPTAADVPRLKYAEMVLLEALRLYPPGTVLGREAVRDCEIGGHRVGAGTSVLMSPWVMHRDARYFDDPEEFRPERWADGLVDRLPRFAFFPFGAGPRRCIGASFAMLEATLALATVAQRYRLTLVPGHVVEPQVDITLRPRHGLRMIVRKRTEAELHPASLATAP